MSVEGKIALARYGKGYRGIKAKLAEEHKAVGLIIFSDPADDGYDAGDPYPRGPWRPMSGIQRGSILYTQILSRRSAHSRRRRNRNAKRLTPAEATNLPHIPTLPINAQDASAILPYLGGQRVPPVGKADCRSTYHVGAGQSTSI